MILSIVMLLSPLFMVIAYFGEFGLIVQFIYILLMMAAAFYMLWGYIQWLSHYFSVSKKRSLLTYMLVGFIFNLTFTIIQFLVVQGPVLLIDMVLGDG